MFRANLDPVTKVAHDGIIARTLANDLMESDCDLSTQYISSKENIIADSLSHDFNLNDYNLINTLYRKCGDQMPKHLKICNIMEPNV
jgi:hypothetical protein